MRPSTRRMSSPHRMPLFYKVWLGGILAAILCIWGLAGFAFYTAYKDPEAIGRHFGRAISGAIKGAQEP